MDKELDFVDDKLLENILLDVNGRRFVWQLLERAHPLALTFVQGQSDATAFNEGVRFLGVNLLAQITNNHLTLYLQMVKENQEKVNVRPDPDDEYDLDYSGTRPVACPSTGTDLRRARTSSPV